MDGGRALRGPRGRASGARRDAPHCDGHRDAEARSLNSRSRRSVQHDLRARPVSSFTPQLGSHQCNRRRGEEARCAPQGENGGDGHRRDRKSADQTAHIEVPRRVRRSCAIGAARRSAEALGGASRGSTSLTARVHPGEEWQEDAFGSGAVTVEGSAREALRYRRRRPHDVRFRAGASARCRSTVAYSADAARCSSRRKSASFHHSSDAPEAAPSSVAAPRDVCE